MRIRPESLGFILLLGSLAAIPPLSIDMGLPAFPDLERQLGASSAGAGLTLSLFMVGFAGGQLVIGPLSDRFGRRPVLLVGLLAYALAGGLCALADGIAGLIGLRLIEGFAAASGTVIAFAMVRDVFSGETARKRLSYVTMVLAVAPVIAPTLGGWALLLAGWRAIFAFLGLAGLALTLAVALALDETRPPQAGRRLTVVQAFGQMLRHRPAIGFAVAQALNFGALFSFVSGSPLLLMGTLGLSAASYGLVFAVASAGIIAGSFLNTRLGGGSGVARIALAVSILAPLLMGVAALTGGLTLGVFMPMILGHTLCRGLIAPNATHRALEPMGAVAGTAAAVVGFLQMAVGALSSAVVAVLFPALGPLTMPLMMTMFALACAGAWAFAALPARAAQMHGERA